MSDGHELVVCPTSADNGRNGEAAVAQLKNGNLLLVYGEFYTAAYTDFSPARVAQKISTDRGRTWSEASVLVDNDAETVFSCNLLRLSSGEILVAYGRKIEGNRAGYFVKCSTDEAKTWSGPWRIAPDDVYHVMANDRLVQLSTGRLVAPVCVTRDEPGEDAKDPRHYGATAFYSDDHGRTWMSSRVTVELDAVGGLQEPGVVELKDGSLMMFSRTSLGHQHGCWSRDGGETWSPPEPLRQLVSPLSPAQIKRVPATGDLLAIYNHNYDPGGDEYRGYGWRSPLTAVLSSDEGKTWRNRRDIEDDPDKCYAYTSLSFIDDEVLLTYNYGGLRRQANGTLLRNDCLKLKILPLDWFYK